MVTGYRKRQFQVDKRVGNVFLEVKFAVDAARTLRTGVMNLAYALARQPAMEAVLVLAASEITADRLQQEWQSAAAVLKPEIMQRFTVCLQNKGRFISFPHDPSPAVMKAVHDLVQHQRLDDRPTSNRKHYFFIILKLLLYRWLTSAEPVEVGWLRRATGCSQPTVDRVLKELGPAISRRQGRRVSLSAFPRDEFFRLVANSQAVRETVRFADRSGQTRSPEAHLHRLEKLSPAHVAVGGVIAAKHHDPELDIIGSPRLDLSLQRVGNKADLGFIEKLDPALKRENDPKKPASVVVHMVNHADPLFVPRIGGLFWVDPVECLLDLYEARLEMQATQFLEFLQRHRPKYDEP